MTGVIHDFQERLGESLELSADGSWIHFYQRIWPEMLQCVRIDGKSVWQKWGVDRMILLPGGRQILIDEKKRSTTFDDFLCEEWSVYRNGMGEAVGWTLDPNKRCDLIAYAIPAIGKCYMLPFEILRCTAKECLSEWKKVKYAYPKEGRNETYVTLNCAVSWEQLFRDMRRIMHRSFGKQLSLPTATTLGGQTVFAWA